MARLELHPDAAEEIEDARAWYAREASEAIAEAFVAELERGIDLIIDMPQVWPMRSGARCLVLRRFPYSVFYRETNEAIQVIAIAHHRRRPGYWHRRR